MAFTISVDFSTNFVRQSAGDKAPRNKPDHAGRADDDEHAAPIVFVENDEADERAYSGPSFEPASIKPFAVPRNFPEN